MWLLIVIMAGYATQVGPFADYAACESAKVKISSQATWPKEAIAECVREYTNRG